MLLQVIVSQQWSGQVRGFSPGGDLEVGRDPSGCISALTVLALRHKYVNDTNFQSLFHILNFIKP